MANSAQGYNIYFNGTLACREPNLIITDNPVTQRHLYIGNVPYEDGLGPYPNDLIRGFAGALDDIIIYSKALSKDEVNYLY